MPLTRRRFLGAAALMGVATGCATPAAARPDPVIDSAEALIAWIAAHPGNASLLVDDGQGTAFSLSPDRARPIGSASKVVHLTAYAQAVVAGRLDPDARVTVAEWERWYVPATDGFAHPKALQSLGLGPDGSARWDDVAAVMIDFSDNSAADLLRATLGDAALTAAATSAGWSGFDIPSFAGGALLAPTGLDPAGVPAGTNRRVAEIDAARAYADDPAQHAAAAQRAAAIEAAAAATPAPSPAPDSALEPALRWFDGSPGGTATQLAGIHRRAETGQLGMEVSPVVRRHLERVLAKKLPAGVLGAGQKGGNLPGLVTNAFTLRRADGTVGVSVLMLSGLAWEPYQQVLTSSASLLLSQRVLLDEGVRNRLRAAVTAH